MEESEELSYSPYLDRENVRKYTLRISLCGIKPAIWRKFEVPSNISLRHLSDLILEMMGWFDYHLNHFIVGMDYYVPRYQYEDYDDKEDQLIQDEYTISDVLTEKGKHIRFEYDFGDSWMHEVKLSSVADYAESEGHHIRFVGGARACPPEDCGGIWGYQELLELFAKRKAHKRLTADEKERLEWCDIDPEFDPDYLEKEDCEDIAEMFDV